jgi:hypothetical protein
MAMNALDGLDSVSITQLEFRLKSLVKLGLVKLYVETQSAGQQREKVIYLLNDFSSRPR